MVSRTAAQTLPNTPAGGQGDDSYTNSVKWLIQKLTGKYLIACRQPPLTHLSLSSWVITKLHNELIRISYITS